MALDAYKAHRSNSVTTQVFNGFYDADIVEKQARESNTGLYLRSLDCQKTMCNIGTLHGIMKDFRIDDLFNRNNGFPYGTYSLRVTNDFLNLYTDNLTLKNYDVQEKVYTYPNPATPTYSDYGSRVEMDTSVTPNKLVDTKIRLGYSDFITPKKYAYSGTNRIFTIMDTHYYDEYFNRSMYFFIGSHLFTGLKIIPYKNFSYFVIMMDATEGLPYDLFQEYWESSIDWKLILLPHENFYSHSGKPSTFFTESGLKASIFTGTDLNGVRYPEYNHTNLVAITSDTTDNIKDDKTPKTRNLMDLYQCFYTETEAGVYEYPMMASQIVNLQTHFTSDIDALIFRVNYTFPFDYGVWKIPFAMNVRKNNYTEKDPIETLIAVPPENILVFQYDSLFHKLTFDTDIDVSLYYPNVYKLSGESYNTDNINRMMLIGSNGTSDSVDYNIDFYDYIRYTNTTASSYNNNAVNGTLPSVIQNYIPPSITYSVTEYNAELQSGAITNPYEYHFKKNRQYLISDSPRYQDYYQKLKEKYKKTIHEYDVKVSDIGMITEGTVLDNHGQITNSSKWVTFAHPMYYIGINQRSEDPSPITIFVDNDFVGAAVSYSEGFIQYLYIPASKVKSDSILHITIFDSVNMDNTSLFIKDSAVVNPYSGVAYSYYILTQSGEFVLTSRNEKLRVGTPNYSDEDESATPEINPIFDGFAHGDYFAYINDPSTSIYLNVIETSDVSNALQLECYIPMHSKDKELVGSTEDEFIINTLTGTSRKKLQNRVIRQNISLANHSEVYDKEYADTSNTTENPLENKTYTDPHICITLSAPLDALKYPARLYIDGVETTDFDRFYGKRTEFVACYLYIPKKNVTINSVIVLETLITENQLFDQWKYDNTPCYRFLTRSPMMTNINLMIAPDNIYEAITLTPNASLQLVWPGYKYGHDRRKIRLWKIDVTDPTYAGTLIDETTYNVKFDSKYGGSLIISGAGISSTETYIAEHLPYIYVRINSITYDSSTLYHIPFNSKSIPEYDVFVDGKRLKSTDYTIISPTYFIYKPTFTAMAIYENQFFGTQSESQTATGYGTQKPILDTLMDDDSSFRNWMITNHS